MKGVAKCPVNTKTEMAAQFFVSFSNNRPHENPLGRYRFVTCIQTDSATFATLRSSQNAQGGHRKLKGKFYDTNT